MPFFADPDPDPNDPSLLPPSDSVEAPTIAAPPADEPASGETEDVEDGSVETRSSETTQVSRSTPSTFQPTQVAFVEERPIHVPVPGLEEENIPGDLVEIGPGQEFVHRGGSPVDLKDTAAHTRERKVNPSIARKEETAEHAWRHLLDGLSTTRLVHVRLQKEVNGSFVSAGARYNVDVNTIRAPEKLIPYGTGSSVTAQRWILSVAPNSARIDDVSAYREFVFERVGPAPPAGWALDSALAFADQEISEEDVPTINEIVSATVTAMLRNPQMLQGGGVLPQQQPPPAAAQMPPNPYMPPFYPPYYPPIPPLARSDDDDRRRRDEEDRRRREDEDRRRRDDDERRKREETIEARHREEMQVLQGALDQQRKDSERRDSDWKDDRARLERERLDADHRSQLTGLTSVIESLKKDVADLRTGGGLAQQKTSNAEWLALAGTLAPIVTNYLAAEREARTSERLQRTDENLRERDRTVRESDQMMRLVTMFGESQLNAARVNGELIQRMQDPSAMMGMTKLLTETMGNNVQMIAQLARSGLGGGGGGGDRKVDIGGVVGQVVETVGTVFGNYTAMKERELEILAQQNLAPQIPRMPPAGVYPPQPVATPRAAPTPVAARPVTPASAPATTPSTAGSTSTATEEEDDDSNKVLKEMVNIFRAAIARRIEPRKVAKMLSAILYSAETFGIEESDPRLAQILKALKIDPGRALKMLFPTADPQYLDTVAEILKREYAETKSEPEPAARTSRARVSPQTPTSAPTPTPTSPSVATTTAPIAEEPVSVPAPVPIAVDILGAAMPGRRGRGRPRTRPEAVAKPIGPQPVEPPAPDASVPVTPPSA